MRKCDPMITIRHLLSKCWCHQKLKKGFFGKNTTYIPKNQGKSRDFAMAIQENHSQYLAGMPVLHVVMFMVLCHPAAHNGLWGE